MSEICIQVSDNERLATVAPPVSRATSRLFLGLCNQTEWPFHL